MMKLSLCITTYNRSTMVLNAFGRVLDDPRIDDIVIVDDCSDLSIYNQLAELISALDNRKIRLIRNDSNLDCYKNKHKAIMSAKHDWVIILDSDNSIDVSYLDALQRVFEGLKPYVVYQPAFARPAFDFRSYEGLRITSTNAPDLIDKGPVQVMLNAMNYCINKHTYNVAFDGNVDPVTSDSLFMNWRLLRQGCTILVVPGMYYEHRIHDGSHYKNNVARTPEGFHDSIINNIKHGNV